MSSSLSWGELLLRLVLTFAAGAAIGINRGEHGKPAGLRTTILVCFAASISMLLANLLLATGGRSPDSFVQLDMMRLPLGILTGMGFIGAGTIIQRQDLVVGVTTAATLWFVTVVGLCLGAGQIGLGVLATAIGLAVLWGLELAERRLPQHMRATLVLTCDEDIAVERELVARLRQNGYLVDAQAVAFEDGKRRQSRFDLRWRGLHGHSEPPDFLADLARQASVMSLRWEPMSL